MIELLIFGFVFVVVAGSVWYVHKHPPKQKDHGEIYDGTFYKGNGGLILFYKFRKGGADFWIGDEYDPDGQYLGRTPTYPARPRSNRGGNYSSGGTPPTEAEKRQKAGLPPLPPPLPKGSTGDPTKNDAPPKEAA